MSIRRKPKSWLEVLSETGINPALLGDKQANFNENSPEDAINAVRAITSSELSDEFEKLVYVQEELRLEIEQKKTLLEAQKIAADKAAKDKAQQEQTGDKAAVGEQTGDKAPVAADSTQGTQGSPWDKPSEASQVGSSKTQASTKGDAQGPSASAEISSMHAEVLEDEDSGSDAQEASRQQSGVAQQLLTPKKSDPTHKTINASADMMRLNPGQNPNLPNFQTTQLNEKQAQTANLLALIYDNLSDTTENSLDKFSSEPGEVIEVTLNFKNRELRQVRPGVWKIGGHHEVQSPHAGLIANLNFIGGEAKLHLTVAANGGTMTKEDFMNVLYTKLYQEHIINMMTQNVTLESITWKVIHPVPTKYITNFKACGVNGNLDPNLFSTSVKPYVIGLKHPKVPSSRRGFSFRIPFLVNELVFFDKNNNKQASQSLIPLKERLINPLIVSKKDNVLLIPTINTRRKDQYAGFYPIAQAEFFGFSTNTGTPKKFMGSMLTPQLQEGSVTVSGSGSPEAGSRLGLPPNIGSVSPSKGLPSTGSPSQGNFGGNSQAGVQDSSGGK